MARISEGLRVYAIGDVHGSSSLLKSLLTIIEADIEVHAGEEAQIIFLGDYIDRGPDSKGVLDLLSSNHLPAPATCLLGNHEEILLTFLEDPSVGEQWRMLGGLETLLSYGVDISDARMGRGYHAARDELVRRLPKRHLNWLMNLHLSAQIDDYFFCHAGVRPGVPLQDQSRADLLWVRDEFLNHKEPFEKVVVHGHTPNEDVLIAPNRIDVDTGVYLTHRLSGVVLSGAEQRVIATGGPNE